MVVRYYGKFDDKNFGGSRKFMTKFNSSTIKRVDTGNLKNPTTKKQDEGKCFNYGGIDHFAWDWRVKMNNSKEKSYKTKYKRLMDSLKK